MSSGNQYKIRQLINNILETYVDVGLFALVQLFQAIYLDVEKK